MSTAFGSIIGSINSNVLQDKAMLYGIANNAISYAQNKTMQERAYWYGVRLARENKRLQESLYRYQMTNAYPFQRKSLEDAGYNPVLAFNSSPVIGSTSVSGSPVNASSPDSVASGVQAGSNASMVKSNLALQESQTDVNNAQAQNIQQDTLNKEVQHGILECDKGIRECELEMKKFDRDTQEYRFYNEMAKMYSETKLNLEQSKFVEYNAISNRIMSNATQMNAEVNQEWTPTKVVGGIATGLLGGLGLNKLGKVKNLGRLGNTIRNNIGKRR